MSNEIGRIDGTTPENPTAKQTRKTDKEDNVSVFSEDDKKLTREVDNQQRDIRIGHKDGHKYRYTDDTHEELVTVSTKGKNKYMTKAEFDKQIKEMLHIDHLPENIRAEYKHGKIVFIDNKTQETLSADDLQNNPEIVDLQKQKEMNDFVKEHKPEWDKQTQQDFSKMLQPDIPEITQEDLDKMQGTADKVQADLAAQATKKAEAAKKKAASAKSKFRTNPEWYTQKGVQALEREWSNIAPKSRGFNRTFYKGIVNIAREIQCDPDDIMSIINSESSFRPDLKTGLMGFIGDTRKAYNFEPSQLTPTEQLPYRRQPLKDNKATAFGKNSRRALSSGELYSVVFLPSRLRKTLASGDKRQILARKYEKSHPEYYRDNRWLDTQKKDSITVGDMAKRVEDFNAYNTSKKYHIKYRGNRHNRTYEAPYQLDEVVVTASRPTKIDTSKLAVNGSDDNPETAHKS